MPWSEYSKNSRKDYILTSRTMTTLRSAAPQGAWGYSAEQLEAIKLFGRKDLTEGCIVTLKKKYENPYFSIDTSDTLSVVHIDNKYECIFRTKWIRWDLELWNQWRKELEIIWHIPHWHDLFSALRDKWLESFLWSESLLIDPDEKIWKKKNIEVNKYIPLLDQPNLDKIISLLKSLWNSL